MLFHFPHLVAVLKSASSESRDYAAEYREYHGKPEQIKARAERNAARRKLGLKPGDGKEADHKNPISNGGSNADRNLRAVKRSTNRKKGSKVGKDDDWQESKHPRASNGQFGSGGGSSTGSSGKKPSKTKRKLERRQEAANQGKVTGAIQTLLSGGSALDNVKWFKQPEAKPKAEEKRPEPKPAEKPKAKPSEHPAPKRPLTSPYESLRDIGEAEPERSETDISTENDPGASADPHQREEQYKDSIERLKWRVSGGDLSQHEADVLRRDLDQSYAESKPKPKAQAKPAPKNKTQETPSEHPEIDGYNIPLDWPKNAKPDVSHPRNPKTGGFLKDVWAAWDDKGKSLGRFKTKEDAEIAFNDWYKTSGYELQQKTERAKNPLAYYLGHAKIHVDDRGHRSISLTDAQHGIMEVRPLPDERLSVEAAYKLRQDMLRSLNRRAKEVNSRRAVERWQEQS